MPVDRLSQRASAPVALCVALVVIGCGDRSEGARSDASPTTRITASAAALPSPAATAGPAASSSSAGQPPAPASAAVAVDFGAARVSTAARAVAGRVVASNDAAGLPFLIVDKLEARLLAFDAAGRFVGDSAVLLGAARGDDSVPGIGERPIAQIRPEERTTPAGRFLAELGENSHGEDILWVDYDNAVSMHRVRATKASERRLQRLASDTAADNRISYGCINVPAAFFDGVVKRLFGPRNGVVYVLPETRPAETLFAAAPAAPAR